MIAIHIGQVSVAIAYFATYTYAGRMTDSLDWPLEAALDSDADGRWSQPGSNICLDFHGDPIKAQLVVFSDGNHHMALQACLQEFLQQHPEIQDIFYATTPPSVISSILKNGQIVLGNLALSRLPDIFISPPNILQQLKNDGLLGSHQLFMRSRGNVFLVRKNNPKHICSIEDLLRNDVRLFISNPVTERASYIVYEKAITTIAQDQGIDSRTIADFLENASGNIVYGDRIHHREAPQCLFEHKADVAVIYYHLALRYTRIFPDLFDIVPLQGNDIEPQASDNHVVTDYHIGMVGDGGRWGSELLDFMLSDFVTQCYAQHGLQRP